MIDECAIAALSQFDRRQALTMVAIAGAESGYEPTARGDALASFNETLQQRYAAFAWEGHLSFGLWQVFLGVHTPLVQTISGKTRPDELANWLFDPFNCARVARRIYESQGFEAWSTYNNAAYLDFEIEASAALSRVAPLPDLIRTSQIAAVSFDTPRLHIDLSDGSFFEAVIRDVELIGPWTRFNIVS